jgi:hypothetical protein
MYKNKYLKYKSKYLNLKKNILFNKNLQLGGYYESDYFEYLKFYYNNYQGSFANSKTNTYSDYLKYLEKKKSESVKINYTNLYFFEASERLEKCLDFIYKKRNNKKLIVLCPGDSPYKFLRFFQLLSKCTFCDFISFPFSTPDKYDKEHTYEYLKEYIPDNYDNLVIMDSISKGTTIKMIIDSLKLKNETNKNKPFYENNNLIIEEIEKELQQKIIQNKNIKYVIFEPTKENFDCSKNNYIINLYSYINLQLEDFLFAAERDFVRCVSENPGHIKNIQIKEDCDELIEYLVEAYKNYLD